jgi:two-component system, chemotaxis family, chemotaxis protein CheY
LSPKVLLIDDSPSIRTIIKLYLMGRPLEFVEATDGAEGLRMAVEKGVDLVIADVNMPVMDGIDFLKALRQRAEPNIRALPVVLLTANKDGDIRSRAMEHGASAFAVKPISREQLGATVDRFLKAAGGAAR